MKSALKNILTAGAMLLAFTPALRAEEKVIPYTLDTCPVSGKAIATEGEAISAVHEGREYRFCCNGCPGKLKSDPASVVEKVNAKLIEKQKANYPTDVCPVSEHKLGEMGDPISLIHGDQLVQLCCDGCKKAYDEDPGKIAAKIQEQIKAKQGEKYPLKNCVISGKELEGKGVEKVYAGTLVRFCCNNCVKAFEKNPLPGLKKLADAKK